MSVNSKMTAIADEIRTLSGTTDTMGLDAMANNVNEANAEVNSQAEIMTQIMNALEGKAIGASASARSSGVMFATGEFTYTTSPSEPGTYDFIFTSDNLQSSTRQIIIMFVKGDTDYSEAWKVFYRDDLNSSFDEYLGSKSYIYHGMNTTVNESSIEVTATSIASDTLTGFWFLAI